MTLAQTYEVTNDTYGSPNYGKTTTIRVEEKNSMEKMLIQGARNAAGGYVSPNVSPNTSSNSSYNSNYSINDEAFREWAINSLLRYRAESVLKYKYKYTLKYAKRIYKTNKRLVEYNYWGADMLMAGINPVHIPCILKVKRCK